MEIQSSVGNSSPNRVDDVKVVQTLLNQALDLKLQMDGVCGIRTLSAIKRLQSRLMRHPDGKVDPGGRTWRYLISQSSNATVQNESQVMGRHINVAGLTIIKYCEQLYLTAYTCPAGVLTIGWGHTGADVTSGLTITKPQAEYFLREDVKKSEKAVDDLVEVELNENEYSALVSFIFNVGRGNFKSSTLRKKLNEGNYIDAAAEFPKWNLANGAVQPGLVSRRVMERELFLKAV
jgi:lysozyme